eukprot:c15893_g1_i1 orf=778-1242(+)
MPPLGPSVDELVCMLHKPSKERNLLYALRLHALVSERGLETQTSIGNYLVSLFMNTGRMCYAQQVFDRLLSPDEYSWSSLITGYSRCGESQQALDVYQKIQGDDNIRFNEYTFVALLKASTFLKDLTTGIIIHSHVSREGLLEENPYIGSALVD